MCAVCQCFLVFASAWRRATAPNPVTGWGSNLYIVWLNVLWGLLGGNGGRDYGSMETTL